MTAVSLEQVTVGYGNGTPVLREVSLTAGPGQLVAVTGPSGAGKTTLLRTMAGLLRPASGTVTVADVSLRDRDHAVTQKVVLVPQDNGLAAILTAGENLQVALIANRVPPADARRRTAESQIGRAHV